MTERSKFDDLRLKTDRQLLQLASTELDLGIRDAHQALEYAENWASAERHYLLAERALAQASRLIRLAGDIRDDERGRVESSLEHLREMLEGLSALGSASAPAGDKTPALARALWKARGCPEGAPEEDWLRAERALKLHAAYVGS
jgi:hypothetical protein